MQKYAFHADGEWKNPATGEWFESIDPFTTAPWALIPLCGREDVDLAVGAAQRAFADPNWRDLSASRRGALVRRLGALVLRDAERLAMLEARDNGKPITEAVAQFRYMSEFYDYFGGLADKVEGNVVPIDKAGHFMFTRHQPYGVVAAIGPWNSPMLLLNSKIVPALAAGNTLVLKPSEHASVSALEFARLVEEAGFPRGVVNVVTGPGETTGSYLVSHPGVAKVAFTGSTETAAKIYRSAADTVKPLLLNLGNTGPNIVMPDADLDQAAYGVVAGAFGAGGQSCMAGARVLVHSSIHDALLDRLVAIAGKAKLGNPLDPATQIGPIGTRQRFDKVLDIVSRTLDDGARCVLGGRAGSVGGRPGWFIEPTIFADVSPKTAAAREEVFGPVLSTLRFDDIDEALAIANDTAYGLVAGLWTRDVAHALTLSSRLSAGTVWINTYRALSYMAPFGGQKASGYGRENGQQTIHEFLQTQSVWLNLSAPMTNPFVIR